MSHCPCCWLNPFCPPFLDKPRGRYRNPAVLVGSTFLVVNSHFWVDKPVDKGCPMLSHSKNQWYPLILDEAGSRLEFYPAFCCGMWPFEREAKRQGHDPWTGGESHGTATDGLVIFSHIYIYVCIYIYIYADDLVSLFCDSMRSCVRKISVTMRFNVRTFQDLSLAYGFPPMAPGNLWRHKIVGIFPQMATSDPTLRSQNPWFLWQKIGLCQ